VTGAARYPPAPGPAGWIVAAGLSVSLHILAVTGLVLGLLGQPQAPAASGTGLVIRTLPPATGSAPTLSRPDLARPAARQADSPARDRLTALEEGPATPAPEVPRTRAARLAAGPAARPADIRRAPPAMRPTATRPTQVPTMRPTAMRPTETRPTAVPTMRPAASSSRPETAPARRVVPVQADPRVPVRDSPASAQAADDPAPRSLAPSEAPARAERLRAEASRADSYADSGTEARPDPPGAIRPARSEPARRAQPEAARRLSPAARTAPTRITEATQATRPAPPPASILAPTRRLATATRPRRGSAPVPQDTRDPASRARRDGPDRRLSDRRAAPAVPDDASAGPGIAAALGALQSLTGTPCHTAQPLTRAGAAPAIAVFGSDRGRLAEARRNGEAPGGTADRPDSDWPDMAARPVTQAQCPALDFIRGAGDDPTDGISLDLWSPTAGDRQPLAGVVVHDGPVTLHLLLIDTAGQVHDLRRFLYPVPDGSQFSVPMTGAGDAGDHHQLLLAIAAPAALPLPDGRASQGRTFRAGPFFETLQDTLARQGITPDLALAGFVFD